MTMNDSSRSQDQDIYSFFKHNTRSIIAGTILYVSTCSLFVICYKEIDAARS